MWAVDGLACDERKFRYQHHTRLEAPYLLLALGENFLRAANDSVIQPLRHAAFRPVRSARSPGHMAAWHTRQSIQVSQEKDR